MKLRVVIVLVLACIASIDARAYDFALRLNYGDSLYFSITNQDLNYVKVVAPKGNTLNNYQNYTKPSGVVKIPSTVHYNGKRYTITAIGARAFASCQDLTSVLLPLTVTTIEDYAFYGCTGLKGTVVVGENVSKIGSSAYYGCTSITSLLFKATNCRFMGSSMSSTVFGNCTSLTSLDIAQGVTRIPDYAFCGLDMLATVPVIPTSVSYVGNYAFAYCSAMSGGLQIPDAVDTIGNCAFLHCHKITDVEMGRNVKVIGYSAFGNCLALTEVNVKAYEPPQLGTMAFAETPSRFEVSIPCVSAPSYQANRMWREVPRVPIGSCQFSVQAQLSLSEAGQLTGSGNYNFDDTVVLTVLCASGYGFDGWSDGNVDNPRRFVANSDMELTARMRPSGTITVRDTVFITDTVYADGVKVIHDTVELNDIARPINSYSNITYNPKTKRISWILRNREKPVSVSLYNQQGECIYTSTGKRSHIDMGRQPSGSYIVRVETDERVMRARFFLSASVTRNQHSVTKSKRH
ncbi:MAG: leucine-rich repeat protein [Bacteroidales bacterium]|nr:leucine-rich repeat protein [Bacteroidales bacterium]